MKAREIREAFVDFFAQKDHKIIKSSSLLPKDDPTILFANAGMNQFKNVFLGLEKRSYKRAASVQKCLRVSGKHNDIEQVGRTNKHHTFFEMLGNFSFGDYFKKEAIAFAWELVTKVFRLPTNRLYITTYTEDEDAFRIWNEEIGIPSERIYRFGKKDNFWAMGDTGPCGPCSELHYDIDPEFETGDPCTLIEKGSDRFIELWNLVFMQYFQDEKGALHSLPSPSIDTGLGLERTAAALQKKKSNFDTDLFRPLIARVCEFSQREYPAGDEGDVSMRIIADHSRAISFLIGDGIMPANEGRGYVLRRLIRRAFRHGNFLGIEKPFLYRLVADVADLMKHAYPELIASAEHIARVCLAEEERFSQTLSSGLRYFHQVIEEAQKAGLKTLPGSEVFKLYDTFGFPLDLSKELAAEERMAVDEKGFSRELKSQRQRARLSWKGDAGAKERKVYEEMEKFRVRFIGYEQNSSTESKVLAVVKDGKRVKELREGEKGEVVLDRTPFYAEAGGQIGDKGELRNPLLMASVEDAYYPIPEIIAHKVHVLSGKLTVADIVQAVVDTERRQAVSNNHTATHLLHASLRQILGKHVKQAGSLVSAERLRFDFTHFSPLGKEEIRRIEQLVNQKIRENIPITIRLTNLEEGVQEGAMAIFEEKYGESVRMVSIGDFSKELCGGVHIHSTGEIGFFKIVSESSIAAGMRRIEALTGEEILKHIQETEDLLIEIQQALNAPRKGVLPQVERLLRSQEEKEKECKALRQKLALIKFQAPEKKVRKIKEVSVLAQKTDGLTNEELRNMADSLKRKIGSGIVILGETSGDRVFLVVSVSSDLVERIKANDIIQKISPLVGGGGGGRPDFAQAGGKKPEFLDQALEASYAVIEKML